MQKRHKINFQIKAKEVRLIDEAGKNIGVVSFEDAIKQATDKQLDLVEMAETTPPVCRLLDYKKFVYMEEKMSRKNQKKSSPGGELKSIRITYNASPHDLEIRVKALEEFLGEGNKIKIEMRLRGRERGHTDFAKKRFQDFLTKITTKFKVEQDLKVAGPTLTMVLAKV